MFWNFSDEPAKVEIKLANLPHEQEALLCELDAMTSSNDENHRIRPRRKLTLAAGSQTHEQNLEPYDVHFWFLHGRSGTLANR